MQQSVDPSNIETYKYKNILGRLVRKGAIRLALQSFQQTNTIHASYLIIEVSVVGGVVVVVEGELGAVGVKLE